MTLLDVLETDEGVLQMQIVNFKIQKKIQEAAVLWGNFSE